MKTVIIAVVVTGVVVAGAILKTIRSMKGSHKRTLSDQQNVHELTTDFLL